MKPFLLTILSTVFLACLAGSMPARALPISISTTVDGPSVFFEDQAQESRVSYKNFSPKQLDLSPGSPTSIDLGTVWIAAGDSVDGIFSFVEQTKNSLTTLSIDSKTVELSRGIWIREVIQSFQFEFFASSTKTIDLGSKGSLSVKLSNLSGNFFELSQVGIVWRAEFELTPASSTPATVPEPSSLTLVACGLLTSIISRQRRKTGASNSSSPACRKS